ncbi:hypothetical protein DLAC_03318 [Tieghemostelium lacteum]|uniref:Uncharacterized protein n=1 Tax=Tieghemostelium lacteum TaxID=361077 RepID=A0A152A241_TIELA|nr:hypothetical protein DLAC_03318 [Tieghemostelium lacteum]|eukprot:KYR00165.1 hypothetical protein DLAC_03318 [Tieghemostelium lacteum]
MSQWLPNLIIKKILDYYNCEYNEYILWNLCKFSVVSKEFNVKVISKLKHVLIDITEYNRVELVIALIVNRNCRIHLGGNIKDINNLVLRKWNSITNNNNQHDILALISEITMTTYYKSLTKALKYFYMLPNLKSVKCSQDSPPSQIYQLDRKKSVIESQDNLIEFRKFLKLKSTMLTERRLHTLSNIQVTFKCQSGMSFIDIGEMDSFDAIETCKTLDIIGLSNFGMFNINEKNIKNFQNLTSLTLALMTLSCDECSMFMNVLQNLVEYNLVKLNSDKTYELRRYDKVFQELSKHPSITSFSFGAGGAVEHSSLVELLNNNQTLRSVYLHILVLTKSVVTPIVNYTLEKLNLSGSVDSQFQWEGSSNINSLTIRCELRFCRNMILNNHKHTLKELYIYPNDLNELVIPLLEQAKVLRILHVTKDAMVHNPPKVSFSEKDHPRFIKSLQSCSTLQILSMDYNVIPMECFIDMVELKHPSLFKLNITICKSKFNITKLQDALAYNTNLQTLHLNYLDTLKSSDILKVLEKTIKFNHNLFHFSFPKYVEKKLDGHQELLRLLNLNTNIQTIGFIDKSNPFWKTNKISRISYL